jgi:flagellar protein FlaF
MSTKNTLPNRAPAVGDPRKTESWALLEAARQLEDARRSRSKDAMLAAAGLNWRLWGIFGESLGDPACGLPDDLRVNMLLLANFIDRRSAEILSDPRPERLDALIRINLQVGGGMLGGAIETEAAASGQAERAPETRVRSPRRAPTRPNGASASAK